MTGQSWEDAKRRFVRAWSPVALALALAAITLAACNAARGISRDVGAAGRAATGTADRATPRVLAARCGGRGRLSEPRRGALAVAQGEDARDGGSH